MVVPNGWVDHSEGVESCHIVDHEGGVFEGVDGNEVAIFYILDISQCAGLNLCRPFVTPPESHVIAEAGAGVEAAIIATGDAWCLANQMTKGLPHINQWTRKCR